MIFRTGWRPGSAQASPSAESPKKRDFWRILPLLAGLATSVFGCGPEHDQTYQQDRKHHHEAEPGPAQQTETGQGSYEGGKATPVTAENNELGEFCTSRGHSVEDIRRRDKRASAAEPPQFEDVTKAVGLGGIRAKTASWARIDEDAYPDLFVGFGNRGEVYINCIEWFYPLELEQKMKKGGEPQPFFSLVNATYVADLDMDGRTDILIVAMQAWRDGNGIMLKARLSALYQQASLTFTERPIWEETGYLTADLSDIPREPTGVGGFELDGDGCPDLYLTRYGNGNDPTGAVEARANRFLRNRHCEGGEGFEDVTETMPAAVQLAGQFNNYVYALIPGTACGAEPVLVATNDSTPSFAFRYSRGEGTFTPLQVPAFSPPIAVMGGDIQFRNDDACAAALFLTDHQRIPAIEFNLQEGTATQNRSDRVHTPPARYAYWGVKGLDADNDGDEDMVAVSGVPDDESYASNVTGSNRIFYYHNTGPAGSETYEDRSMEAGVGEGVADHYGAYTSDYDLDGRTDFAVTAQAAVHPGPEEIELVYRADVRLLRNVSAQDNNWIGIIPEGERSDDTEAVASVRAGSVVRHRALNAVSSVAGRSALTTAVGLGDAPVIDELVIHWGDGTTTTVKNPGINQYVLAR